MLHRNPALGVMKLRFQADLSDCRIQVVHNHQHYGGSLTRTAWVLIDGVSPGEGGRERGHYRLISNKKLERPA